jgi:hypothetical protein
MAIENRSSMVEKIAQEVTIRIFTDSAPGFGVTIAHTGKTYTVLTCHY